MGILVPRRRLEDLLEAIRILKDEYSESKVILYASGNMNFDIQYVNKLMRIRERLGLLPDVIFLNSLSEEELAYMYRYADIFVFPCEPQT